MAKPSSLPRWADTVTGDTTRVVVPTSGKKDVGWAAAERPGGQHLNWLFNLVYQWIYWLTNEAIPDTETWRIMPTGIAPGTNTNWSSGGFGMVGSSAVGPTTHNVGLPARDGWRITQVRARVSQADAVAGRVTLQLGYQDDAGGPGFISGAASSAGSVALQNLTLVAGDANVTTMLNGTQAGRVYFAALNKDGSATAVLCYYLEITYVRN